MGCLDYLFSATRFIKEIREEAKELKELKAGKSKEQKRAIDFFLADNVLGCLTKSETNAYSLSEYQNLVKDKCIQLNLKKRALQKIGLDESQISEITPLNLSAYVFDDDCLIRIDNGVAVSNQFSISWIFFSATQLYTYTYIFSTTSDDVWEYTKEFFYSDITNITTTRHIKEKIDKITISNGCFKKSSKDVAKNNYVIDKLEIIVPGTSFSFTMRNSENVERSIQGAKAMIREKKYMKK